MRIFVFVFATVVTLLIASTASAALPIQYLEIPADNTNPTVKSCVAYSAYGQKCRECRVSWNSDGTVAGYTCVSVAASNMFCTCGDVSRGGCYPKGQCAYM